MEHVKKYTKVILNILFPLFGIYAVCFWGPNLFRFFLPFAIGWIIAMIANPLVRFLEKKLKIVRKHGSILIVVLVLAVIIGLFYLLIAKLIFEVRGLLNDLPELYMMVKEEVATIIKRFEYLFLYLPQGMQEALDAVSQNIGQYFSIAVQKLASPTVEVAGNMAKGIPNALVHSIITILSSYFFIAERDKIFAFWKRYVPKQGVKYYAFFKKDVKHLIGGYFLAQFRIMFVVALILAVGFFVLGVNYGMIWALVIAFLDFLPLFGTGTALIPWALVKLLAGEYAFAIGLVLLYVLTQVIRQIIQPKIVGDTMGLPPLLTLFFLYLGYKFSGLTGMILAVPIGLLVLNLYQYGMFDSLIENTRYLLHDLNEFRKS